MTFPIGSDLPVADDATRCVCARCPSFVAGDHTLHCVYGKSPHKVVERGCICRTCPVHLEHQFSSRAFCLRGPAK